MKFNKLTKNILILFSIFPVISFAQDPGIVPQIIESYNDFREPSIDQRRIRHRDIQPLIQKWKEHPDFEVKKVGTSIEGRDLSLLSIGSGETDVFLWSQMHGDESTATMALFDIFNFLTNDSFHSEKELLLKNLRLHFLPMLNPDGAQDFERRNALGIDINRDALRLQSPEGRTLKRVRDSLEADYGFNLHDQSRYYNVQSSQYPATISFLAPAYDEQKSVNETRGNAMKLIVKMNETLQSYAPGQVGRYNDDFEPRAFGDNIQKWGTSTILIESGGFPEDPEKQEIRRLNVLAILTALFSISDESYTTADISEYEKIPENDSKLFDLKLIGLEYQLMGDTYILDLGINYSEIPAKGGKGWYYKSRIADQGDLSVNYAYKTLDALGYKMVPGKVYPEPFKDLDALSKIDFSSLLNKGFSYVKVTALPKGENHTRFPVIVVNKDFKPSGNLQVGIVPTFFLEKEGKLRYAVINGFVVELGGVPAEIENGLIQR